MSKGIDAGKSHRQITILSYVLMLPPEIRDQTGDEWTTMNAL